MKQIILFRGLPGSGKSTLAESLCEEVWSADQYFEKHGEYLFDPTRIKDAHQWCQAHVEKSMSDGVNKIGVANTFTQEWEMKHYFDLAKKYKYRISTIIVENRHGSENLHGVPVDKIEMMEDRFEIKLY
jgi:predicted kinase